MPPIQARNRDFLRATGLKPDEELFRAQRMQLQNVLREASSSAAASLSHFFAGATLGLPSGDFVDATGLSDDKLLIRFGDVMGHGRPAADISFTLQKILHDPTTSSLLTPIYERKRGLIDAGVILETLFQYKDPNFGRFYTMTSTIIDPATRTIISLFSGSDPFFQVRMTNTSIEVKKIHAKEATTAVISLDTEVITTYNRTAKTTPLVTDYQPGDILIYMSDGLLTRTLPEGEYLGDHFLLEKLIFTSVGEGFDGNIASRLHKLILKNTEKVIDDDATIFVVNLF